MVRGGAGGFLPEMPLAESEPRAAEVYGREWVPVVTAAESTALDREAREEGGIPERVLMEDAGRSAALVLDRLFPRGRVVGVVGSGHNGGDALVLLRNLKAWGREVACVPASSRLPDLALLHGHDVPIVDPERAAEAFAGADVLVDGILGTGAVGAPRAGSAALIQEMNRSGRPILALDVPSGVDPTTGQVPGEAVAATVTVTFGWPKLGLLFHPGRSRCGRLVAVEIGFPPLEAGQAPTAALITPEWAARRLPQRAPDAHKGSAGCLLVVAGSFGMGGAAGIVGRTAVRAGAGLVYLASAPANREILQVLVPDAVFVDREDDSALQAAAARADAVVIGPGLGLDEGAQRALDRALALTSGQPVLLDADALTLLARQPEELKRLAETRPAVITPHPGEFSRLTGVPIPEVRAAPVQRARDFAEETGCIVLLKGAPSVVAAAGEPVLIGTTGSSDLATAGMGDALAGVIGAFLAAGVEARTAAALGLFYSARAADLAGRGRSLSTRDVAECLDRAFACPGARASSLALPFVTFDQPARW